MHYQQIEPAVFLERPNRFIAHCRLESTGEGVTVHVKNTGRCRELLVPGAKVYLEKAQNPGRKTLYDLVMVQKGERLIQVDSQAPNLLAWEAISQCPGILPGVERFGLLRREVTFGSSRFDLYGETDAVLSQKVIIEVKGVTLERDGAVFFPDAPTLRGAKHLRELAALTREGYRCAVLFVVQMEDVAYFTPNRETDPAFAEALEQAAAAGVMLLAHDCLVSPEEVRLNRPVEIRI